MCRHLAYVGPPEPVGELLTRGVHALRTQAWAPRDMRGGGTINADGFGVAWWRHAGHPGQARVSRYRNAAPIWTDPAVDEVLPQIESTAVLGAVRSATVGMPVERAACAPFIDDGWAFSHNGVVPNWRKALTAALADLDNAATRAGATRMFQTADLLDAESATDSAAMWVLLRGLLTPGAPPDLVASPADALRLLLTAVLAHAPAARLNFLLGDGSTIWATAWEHALSALVTDDYAIVASEPYDADPRWRPIPEHSLVCAAPGRLTIEPLDRAVNE
ncbi:ergothioneine biosynthesis protein EgtC [Nocardia cyriacigeorgica]|uniref:ergothioneine biosynthesis protein EgtC n=1 Tax=Nocardia cyriacigeorgica TaxID=135487 RepID=UPI001895D98F|nr:ergothioneine biosynthesis protein EgtC [Nocardia cyriacigeorgica]MBF6086378.1 ergothioneine biosynthesis protein EgtC [Nocardia cyriacigeorgica]MBF6091309.1 ergothioneine biosynthesis protein EgtC [Nocardia cyriacigeorgica]MBF6395055.1 ergothioneine biosynthesis protein EgtC [Nocardia cyriacigeorgica]MBF6400688.1 ergothioneine biosynthesis protein EgtC [Nocardia cyriacigeorgica]